MKRVLCLLLALCLLPAAGMPAANAVGRFSDIPDAATQTAAELLSEMGIIGGTGGTLYQPNLTFDRAMLAVIGVKLSGITDVSTYGGTVRFPDVRASHWAHKWIMAAVDTGILVGGTDGNFHPEDPMLYGYLVTVLMKLLGYEDADVGLNWPQSYISKAEALGLSEGMKFSANDKLTRGQAARLIYNFLFMKDKAGNVYLEKAFGASYADTVLFFETNGTASVITDGDKVYSYGGILDESLRGKAVTMLTGRDGKVLTLSADPGVSYRQVSVKGTQANRLELDDGSSLPAAASLPVWEWDGTRRAFSDARADFWPGETVTLASRGDSLLYILRDSWENKSGLQYIFDVTLFFEKTANAVLISNGENGYIFRGTPGDADIGRVVTLLVDKNNEVQSIIRDDSVSYETVTLKAAQPNRLEFTGRNPVTAAAGTAVFQLDGSSQSYSTARPEFWPGEQLTLALKNGSLLYILRDAPEHKSSARQVKDVLLRTQTIGGISSVITADGELYPVKGSLDLSLCGRTGLLLLDQEDNAVGFVDTAQFIYRSVTLAEEAHMNGILPEDGAFMTIPSETVVWGEQKNTYNAIWLDIRPGEELLFAYNSAGVLQYIYRKAQRGSGSYSLAILEEQPSDDKNPVTAAFGQKAASAALYKNGVKATPDMLDRWDVLQYYENANIVEASSLRISAYYGSPSPNPVSPSSVKILGMDFDLLPEASQKMADFPPAGRYVFLLSSDGKTIADIRSTGEVAETTLSLANENKITAGSSLQFEVSKITGSGATQNGKLCRFRGQHDGSASATAVTFSSPAAGLDPDKRTLGETPLAPWCVFYEQVGTNGHAVQIKLSSIQTKTVAAGNILFAEISPSGYVTALLFNNVTGDAYTYGMSDSWDETKYLMGGPYTQTLISVVNGNSSAPDLIAGQFTPPSKGAIVGIAAGNALNGESNVSGIVTCEKAGEATRFDFSGGTSVLVDGKALPLDTSMVYVPSIKDFLELDAARAYCRTFEVYTDPWGYKARFITGLV